MHAQLSLCLICVRATDSPSACDVRALYVHVRPLAHTALSPRVFVLILLSFVLRGTHVITAPTVHCPCLLGTSSVQLSNKHTELSRTIRSKYVLRTYNARCSHRPTPYSSRNKRTFTTLARRKSENTLRASTLQRTVCTLPNSQQNRLTFNALARAYHRPTSKNTVREQRV